MPLEFFVFEKVRCILANFIRNCGLWTIFLDNMHHLTRHMFLQRNKTKCQGGTNLLELSDPFHSQIDIRRTDSPYLTTLIGMRNSVIKQCGHKYNLHHLVTVIPEVLVARTTHDHDFRLPDGSPIDMACGKLKGKVM